jgi:hypothetical protein
MSINLTLTIEVEMEQVTDVIDAFDVMVLIFQNNMQTKIIRVIKAFLQFLEVYDSHQIHNMLSIMLDPCIKSLQVVKNYVGCEDYICLAFTNDAHAVILLLMMVFEILNPIV